VDRHITIRFYSVGKSLPQGPSLREVFEEIFAKDIPEREVRLATGLSARLERFELEGNDFTGEFTRIQSTNFLSEVHVDGTRSLSIGTPLGHGVAFRFRQVDHVFAVQYDTRVLSPGRMFAYLRAMRGDASFDYRPKVDESNWLRMQQNPLRKLAITIASPDHLGAIENAGAAVGDSIRLLGEAYSAPFVTIELGMGRRNGELSAATKEMASQVFALFANDQADVRKMKAVSETEAGERNDEINLIDEILSEKDELALPDNDPDRNYEVRRNFLRDKMHGHG